MEETFEKFEGETLLIEHPNQWTHELDQWIEEQTELGFDTEWRPDRSKDSKNPISLLQLSSLDTCVLIRTKPRQPLPQSVKKFLLSKDTTKVCAGYDGSDVHKMRDTFGFGLENVISLDKMATARGFRRPGIKGIAEGMGIKIKKDKKISASDWARSRLTPAQIEYAADDAYYSLHLYHLIESLPLAYLCPVTECPSFFVCEGDEILTDMAEYSQHVVDYHINEELANADVFEYEKKLYYLAKKMACCHHCLANGQFTEAHERCPFPDERPCWKCLTTNKTMEFHGQCAKIPVKVKVRNDAGAAQRAAAPAGSLKRTRPVVENDYPTTQAKKIRAGERSAPATQSWPSAGVGGMRRVPAGMRPIPKRA
eukprot:GEMP01036896.1.p1 GENE.GEMP01036896.1~~GEMP01036896.1.p1  ORF type:complete len:375 (+),score=73.63 GEMP01036896.1:24-1127(+)